jgi:hypothetical protein
MSIIDVASVLRNIRGFAPGPANTFRNQQNDIWHWFKHCFGFLGDTPGVMTVKDDLQIGQEIGRKAADRSPFTYVKAREENNEIIVYWEPSPGARGLFMVVRPLGASGEIVTLFSPDDRKRYFDLQPPIAPTFH